jgi:hypothetical protein
MLVYTGQTICKKKEERKKKERKKERRISQFFRVPPYCFVRLTHKIRKGL